MGVAAKSVERIDAGVHPVVCGTGALAALQELLGEAEDVSARFVLGDENTLRHCLPELLARVPALRDADTIAVEAGEGSKRLGVCEDIWMHLAGKAADRKAVLVNLGGGVVTDLGGFVAGAYKRGIRCVHVPTTLMGMADAAIGGKSGVDLAGVKNVVGLFHFPLATFVHPPFLRTLGKRELLNGVAEMIKHGLVRDADHYEAVCAAPLHDLDALAPLVCASAAIKCAVVKEDPLEQGPRRVLNFGHSVGHGIEALSWESEHRSLLHGEAVAVGMVCEAWLSWRLGLIDREANDRIARHLLDLYPPFLLHGAEAHRVLELMRNDKKNASGGFRFALLTGIGRARVDVPVTAQQVLEALDHYRLLVRG